VLTAQELRLLVASYHRPSFALAVLSELAAEAPVNEVQRIRLDENLTYFQQCVGECERLLRTPIPLSYTRHTSRFMVSQCARVGATCCCVLGWDFGSWWGLRAGLHLRPFFVRQDLHSILPARLPACLQVIWLSCLPLGLWRYCGWGTIPLTVVISFLLLGIEEIGGELGRRQGADWRGGVAGSLSLQVLRGSRRCWGRCNLLPTALLSCLPAPLTSLPCPLCLLCPLCLCSTD
jgi:hypothetical protein